MITMPYNGEDVPVEAWIQWHKTSNHDLDMRYVTQISSLLITLYVDQAELLDDGTLVLELPIFTEYRREDTVYRAHMNYRRQGPWLDWCYVTW